MYVGKYQKAPAKIAKSVIMDEIIDKIHEINGNFVRRSSKTQHWVALDTTSARCKVGHAIRDLLSLQKQRRGSEPIMRTSQLYSDTFGIPDPDESAINRSALSSKAKKLYASNSDCNSRNPSSADYQALFNSLSESDLPPTSERERSSKKLSYSASFA